MYLEKLEIQGFKSFASKNILVFPGMLDKSKRGITSVVGPNGSGKSNVADAVRWALGEQSMKTLRGKKSEDVIFSGSDKKGKLGMAEVSLHLNNEDGVKSGTGVIDYSQIVLTRRLYRNGDSEYMLNGNRVRLSDIQMLLARAKFGQKTYSVIGQGMVEGFLNTSLAERKEFFDEATGVKQYQIKRDDSLNKLRNSYENLAQAQMLLLEIEPRLKSLTRQVGRLHKRGELEIELKALQTEYYSCLWHDISRKFNSFNNEYLELEKIKFVKEKKLEGLNRDLEQMKIESEKENEFDRLQIELSAVQSRKNDLQRQLMKIEAQLEAQLEASGKHDLAFLIGKKDSLAQEKEAAQIEADSIRREIGAEEEKIKVLEKTKNDIDAEMKKVNIDFSQVENKDEDDGAPKANRILHKIIEDLKVAETISDFAQIKALVNRIRKELKELREIMNTPDRQSETNGKLLAAQNELSRLSDEKEKLVSAINENRLSLFSRRERLRFLDEKSSGIGRETLDIENRLKRNAKEVDFKELDAKQEELKQAIGVVEAEAQSVRDKIGLIRAAEEKKRSRLFSLQRELSELQGELNELNNNLQNIKINATRFETKLEDLEIEIRQELGGLNEVKNADFSEREFSETQTAESRNKINQIKKQLELIGGIDPQAEEEYNNTKERFDFLNGQINDFSGTVDSLRKIIKELDGTIKEQFDKEFKIIADNFEKYFKVLFNGGNAKIVKVLEEAMEDEEADDGKEKEVENKSVLAGLPDINKIKFLQKHNATGLAGIEIKATPPGKKIGSISMLSGGERALTAIALICAIISSNPSPFVVLDEVDAALDEANSERLAKILEELSRKTQFIVITHNRASMRRSNILYGVTMGDDGVSKLLSVKLDEITMGR